MSQENTVAKFIADRWVSWLMEFTVLLVIAYFTISETRKTQEHTREMLSKYDAVISQYASEKSKALDQAMSSGAKSIKQKAESLSIEDVKSMLKEIKNE